MATTPPTAFRLNTKLKTRLKKIADTEERDLTYIVDKALTAYVENWEKRHGVTTKD